MSAEIHRDLIALLPRLRRFAYGLTGSLDEGDDLVQAACERALSRLDLWQPGTRLDSWMFKIVQNLWFSRARRFGRRVDYGPDNDLDLVRGGDVATETEARLMLGSVNQRIGALPEDQREVLLLVSVDGMSYREAAEILGVPIGTIMSRLARARIALGRSLDQPRPARAAAAKG